MGAVREDMQFIISSKGKRQIVLNGYYYNKQKTLAGGVISWECVKRYCAARVKTNDGRIIGCVNEHNCILEPDRIQALRIRANLREVADAIRERLRNNNNRCSLRPRQCSFGSATSSCIHGTHYSPTKATC